MSIEEKIQAMESIWDDLCNRADSIASPSWHKEVLDEREEGIKRGDDKFVDWDTAKKNIRNLMKIKILSSASQDLIDGYWFYEKQSEGGGAYFLDTLYSDIDSLVVNAGIRNNSP